MLTAAEETTLHAYVVLSLLLGARTEELRALTWSHVDLDGTPPSIMVWRSVREGGDTKTRKSRRTLAMPRRCVDALKLHRERQDVACKAAGEELAGQQPHVAFKVGTELDAHNVRRSFRAVLKKAGLNEKEWTPREMRRSFVSLLSDSGIPLENISRLVGHSDTTVTERSTASNYARCFRGSRSNGPTLSGPMMHDHHIASLDRRMTIESRKGSSSQRSSWFFCSRRLVVPRPGCRRGGPHRVRERCDRRSDRVGRHGAGMSPHSRRADA